MQIFTVVTALSLPLAWASPQFRRRQDDYAVGQIVQTSSGPVAGHAAAKYSEVSEYLGIRFGQAPIGDLRFAAPLKYTGSSLINASAYGSSCIQLPSSGGSGPTADEIALSNITTVGLELIGTITSEGSTASEDCLFLNLWAKPQCGEPLKAVMVFIHGGGFSGGDSGDPTFNGASLVEKEDVVVVNLNYRTSILGFPGNPDAPNNVALLDQRLAVEWVRDNIANFGGDPTRITLLGQSAGGASTDYYSYAWTEDPIIHSVILQSGTSFSFTLPYTKNASAANWYGVTSSVGCGNASTDPTTLLACMRSTDVETIMKAVSTTGLSSLISSFAPTADGTLVFANYSEQTPASIPVLVGSNDYESGLFRTELALGNSTWPDAAWDLLNFAGFNCPAGVRANASVTAGNPTWRYRYFGVYPNTNISTEGGAWHGAEIPLIFGTTISPPNSTADEVAFQSYIQGAWATFAKDPVNGLSYYGGGWPLYNPAEETLIRLAYDNTAGTHLAFPDQYDEGCADASLAPLIALATGS